jgi:hypothetical protein
MCGSPLKQAEVDQLCRGGVEGDPLGFQQDADGVEIDRSKPSTRGCGANDGEECLRVVDLDRCRVDAGLIEFPTFGLLMLRRNFYVPKQRQRFYTAKTQSGHFDPGPRSPSIAPGFRVSSRAQSFIYANSIFTYVRNISPKGE